MFIIGLTGPSGAGKGTVSDIFAKFGLPVMDADQIYHALLLPPSPCLNAIVARFGARILTKEGTLDRAALGDAVFTDPAALEDLNHIAHTFVMQEVNRQLDQLRKRGIRAAVLDAPQLFEAGAHKICSTVVSVLADKALRAERIMRRDGIGMERAMRRIQAQKSDTFFRTNSNYIIENNGSTESLIPKVKQILVEVGVIST